LFSDELLKRFFGTQRSDERDQQEFAAAGSGVIVDAQNGYVLTNSHLLQDAELISVVLSDGRRFEAEKVGMDSVTDLGVLRIDAKNLFAAPLGQSDKVRVGDYVIAVGNPFGLSQTVTMGIVSAVGRTGVVTNGSEDFIQTDASINPGSSGGALLNISGEVIGINSAILAPSGTNVGIGFAVPINTAREIAMELIEKGEIRRGQMGVALQDLTPELARALETDAANGAVVTQVGPDSPAEAAKLQVGDVITQVDGADVFTAIEVTDRVRKKREGQSVGVTVKRRKLLQKVRVILANTGDVRMDLSETVPLLSTVVVAPVEGGSTMVVDVDSNSPAGQAGLQIGDAITSVNLTAVSSPAEIAILARQHENKVLLQIARSGSILFVPVLK
jgi:serine protease DegQ